MAKDKFYIDDPHLPKLPLFDQGVSRDDQAREMGRFASGVRDTSRGAYQELIDSGELGAQSLKLYAILGSCPHPMSLREIQKASGVDINAVSGRINDMKKSGVVVECLKRACTVTGRIIIPVEVAHCMK